MNTETVWIKRENDAVSSLSSLRKQAAYYYPNEYGLLAISGKNAAAYLQSQSSNDINSLKPGFAQFTCLLDRKAHVLAYFHLFKSENITASQAFYLIAKKEQLPTIVSHLEQFRFAAQVEFTDLSQEGKFIAIAGPQCSRILYQSGIDLHLTALPELDTCNITYDDYAIRIFRHTNTGENSYFLWIQNKDFTNLSQSIAKAATELNFIELSKESVNTARIEAGLAKFGVDFDQNNLLPETGLEGSTVSYTKGCFAGQEVLARVKSHGMPAKALIGLIIESANTKGFTANSSITSSGEEIGILKSNIFSSALNKIIAFAFLKRDYRIPEKKITAQIEGQSITATVTMPPFINIASRNELAKKLYDQAVQQYIKGVSDTIPLEITALLKEALTLDPKLEDAYEALAVILGRYEQLDEAIALMKKLAQINADSIMAHSNLSQFYIQQGNKELAEEEKAIALGIRMKLAAAEAVAESRKKKEENIDTEETKKRMAMFEQVLAIDSEDFFANAGFGECLVAMKEYSKAIPYLEKAIVLKANHMPSYSALSIAYKNSGATNQAKDLLQQAIELAAKRGDTTVLQQLRDELAAIL